MERLFFVEAAGSAAEWAFMLGPLAIYLLTLLLIHQRKHPLLVSGPANMLGVLFAVSGFMLLGPPSWMVSGFRAWGFIAYANAYASYLVLLALLGRWLVRRQRHTLVLFNINPNQFAAALQDVLAKLKLDYTATPGRVALAAGRLVLDLETSFIWNNVTLNWHGDEAPLRSQIEGELRHALAEVEIEGNLASLLLMMMAAGILLLISFAGVLYLIVKRWL